MGARDIIEKKGKTILDSDISALYIPSQNRNLKNLSQKKKDQLVE